MTIGEHLPDCVSNGKSFERKKGPLHSLVVICRTTKNFLSRRTGQEFASFGQPNFVKPIIANRSETIHRPASKAKFVVHGPGPVRIRGVDNDRTEGKMAGNELRHFKTSSWIARCTRLRTQIMIEGNKMRVAKAVFTLGNHCRGISPNAQLPTLTKLTNNGLECCYSLAVIFE